MNIIVYDVAADQGGALTILNEFFHEVINHEDKSIHWKFIVSKPEFKESENVKVMNYPWIKKSWFHRLYFDYFVAPKLVKANKSDKIFSIQNTLIPRTRVKQIVYVHQPLPFIEQRFSFKENKTFWIYQNIISKSIYKAIKNAAKVIVQTEWMKKACIERTCVKPGKIVVVQPSIGEKPMKLYSEDNNKTKNFFYPASSMYYKNHRLIINACKILKESNLNDYRIYLTLIGNENEHIDQLMREVNYYGLPIEFIGNLSHEEVYDYYTKSVLLFPSYVETFGLPLLEAKMHGSPILASDTPFSHEILDGYTNVSFFDAFSAAELAGHMRDKICNIVKYKRPENASGTASNKMNSILEQVIF